MKLSALAIGYARFRVYAVLHTYANKLAGLALFALPVAFVLISPVFATAIVCCVATFAAAEELLITCTARILDRDVKGIRDRR